ncbi:CehA/McbA family metallohydrolase [Candidatus Oscillochloris fontis]|uniref:CehA/McbA family metallohydrolase n=1 Tax=Candidatus Oscillochloris fontis TaxID=2496868 RepID=UPI00101CD02B|nr:CehA/McbA family metallohydrolase [Candidatus Oscillochloris fontis]
MSHSFIYPGALHIHTTYSDGSGSFPQVIAAAQAAGLRWIIVTDHDTQAGAEFAGWHAGLLVIVGHEITPDHNHFLALNLDHVVSNQLPPQAFIDAVYAEGGFGIIAHPDERVTSRFTEIYRWDDWMIDGPRERAGQTVGLELWNLMSDWAEHLTPRNRFVNFLWPKRGLRGPTRATLTWWDQLNMAGKRTFGVGGVDAHALKHRVPWGEVEVFPYRWIFKSLTNYLMLDTPLDRDPAKATQQVYAALRSGHSYFVNRLDGDAPAIEFYAQRKNQDAERYGPGDAVSLGGGELVIKADVGCRARLRLIRNGVAVAHGRGHLRYVVTHPGVYRLEGRRWGRPWLYSNPIWVRG